MGEGHKDAEKSSVCFFRDCPVASVADAHGMLATKIYPQLSVILMERRRRLSFCWQVVRANVFPLYCTRVWLNDCETVQSRDLASAMRSALTTRGLADCASLILKTVSMTMVPVYCLQH